VTTLNDQTNGDQKKLFPKTLIFFSSTKNLGIRQLRKDFRICKGKLVKIKKDDYDLKVQIETFYAVLSNQLGDLNNHEVRCKFYDFLPKNKLTHILVAPYQTCTKIIGHLKYTDEIIGGVDVSPEEWDELSLLLDEYGKCVNALVTKDNFLHALKQNFKQLEVFELTSEPFSKNLFTDIQDAIGSYLNPLLLDRLSAIKNWQELHRWRDISEVMIQTSAAELPANENIDQLAA